MAVELIGDWTAIHDRMPGKRPTLRVHGTCSFPTAGWSCEPRRRAPQGINPAILMLDLLVTEPGGPVPEVVTEVDVSWVEETDDSFSHVHVMVEGGDGRLIDVQEVS